MLANIIRNAKKTVGGGGGGIVTGGDPYYSAVSLLLPMDGTNGSTTFTDSSLNAATVTAVGNAQISTTQSKYGGASGAFDGTGDYLSIPDSSAPVLGSSDWTIEAWIYVSVAKNFNCFYAKRQPGGYGLAVQVDGSNNLTISASTTGSSWVLAGSSLGGGYTAGSWIHVAVVRSGNTITGYKNGVSTGTQTLSGTIWPSTGYAAAVASGLAGNTSQDFNGYLDDLRISQFARYTSNFTPPTAALPTTASSTPADPYYGYTSLLLHMDGSNASTAFVDSGPNALTVTASGDAKVSTGSPYFGTGAAIFDGSGDFLSVPSGTSVNFGTGDFTVEMWARYSSLGFSNNALVSSIGPTVGGLYFAIKSNLTFLVARAFVANDLITAAVTWPANTWAHIALSRSGSTMRVFKDGVLVSSVTNTQSYSLALSGNNDFAVGATQSTSGVRSQTDFFNGQIDDLRITKYARYTSAFAPPAQAFPNIYNPYASLPVSGAALWLAGDDSSTLYTDAGTSAVTKSGDLVYQWTDKSGNSRNAIQTTSGNRPTWVAPANARNNLGALAFNGTSQFLNLASDPIGTNDYTIEFWMKQEATTASYWVILDSRVSGNAIGYPVILYNNSSTALSFYNNGWLLSATVSVSTWTHVAITRSSGTIRMFVNGSIASSGTDTSSYNTFRQLGKAFDPYYFKGQIQNLIIYNGQALYTANFTPWMS